MNDRISVFYANVRDAVSESGLSFGEVTNRIKAAGITALDFDYKDIKCGEAELAGNADLKINSIYAFFDLSEDGAFDKAKEVIDTAENFGAVAMLVPKKLSEEEIFSLKNETEKDKIFSWLDSNSAAKITAENLEKLSLYGDEKNIPCCVENFDNHRSLTERKYELQWFFSKAPHLRFNLDTGNSAPCGEDILELLSLFGEKAVNVHCKDRYENMSVSPVGDGIIPIAEIKKELIKSGYNGRFSIEVFGAENPLEAIIKSAEFLKRE